MSSTPLLSIIIVAYKSRDEIAGCLQSLPRILAGGAVEMVVVDNSPGDGTEGIVRDRFPWTKYVAPESNLGFGRANNFGYALADPGSEFVLFLNPDTVCSEAALAHCITRLRADSSIGLISPKLVLANGSMDLACRRSIPSLWDGFCRASGLALAFTRSKWFSGYNLTYLPEDGTYDVGAINGAFMMGRRSVFDAVAASDKLKAGSVKLEAGSRDLTAASDTASSELKAYSLPPRAKDELRADRLPLTAADAPRPPVFDERFFMYGDDLDLCIRVRKAGYRIVYDGAVSITHLKGVSVAKDLKPMREAIFDANRDVYLKHFNPRNFVLVRWKYQFAFSLWKRVARLRAQLRGHRKVRPL